LLKQVETLSSVVLILAAGSSRRMGGVDKIFTKLADMPVFLHSVSTFISLTEVVGCLIVTSEESIERVKSECEKYTIKSVLGVIAGGSERNDSTRIGLQYLASLGYGKHTVLIHDAARPLITPVTIRDVLHNARKADGAIPVVPVTDTIKRIDDRGYIVGTVTRSELGAVQTPQAFQLDYILKLHQDASQNDKSITDDSYLVERAGGRVIAVPGRTDNIKITCLQDIEVAQKLFESLSIG